MGNILIWRAFVVVSSKQRVKNGAPPQASDAVEDDGPVVGSIENPRGAHGCPCIKWGLDSSWTPRARSLTGRGP